MSRIFGLLLLVALHLLATEHPLIEEYLQSENIWIQTYENHKRYEALLSEQEQLQHAIARHARLGDPVRHLQERATLLEAQIRIYEGLSRSFVDLIEESTPQPHEPAINLVRYLRGLPMAEFEQRYARFEALKEAHHEALAYLQTYQERVQAALDRSDDPGVHEALKALKAQIGEDRRYFELARTLLLKRDEVIAQKRRAIQSALDEYRNHDLMRLATGVGVVLGAALLAWLLRRTIRRFVLDEEQSLFWTKSVNLAAIVSVALFLVIFYIDNLLYALTFIGFIAAALTIVMKEAVLNLAAWSQLLIGSKIRIGDRILIYHEMQPIIGDVLQISPMRMTLYEEITHNSAAETKRAGRVIFVPNNFLFTRPIFNYTHDRMKTIYDLIQIELGYETNFQKARTIAEEAVDRYTHRHIEMARRQYEHLRERYAMRGKDLRPRIQFMTGGEAGGVSMYIWYVAPYREILSYRTDITLAVLERFRAEPDIHFMATGNTQKLK